MSYDAIKEGDRVTVYAVGDLQGSIYGVVRHIPQATGECWVIEDVTGLSSTFYYVQTFAWIRKS